MVSTGSYILSAALLAALALSLGFSAVRLRKRLLPAWEGVPARLVEAVLGVALLIWLSELLGVVDLLYAWALVAASLALSVPIALAFGPGGRPGWPGRATPASLSASSLIAIAVVALVFAHWGLTTKDALDRGIFNFDSLWYHLPFAVEMAHSHSVTGLHYTETVFTNWFYPQNSELLHAVGILLIERDTLSLFLNFGWLAIAFLAAWCVGRPYGRAPLTVVAAAIVLECHTLVVREPGAAKNDLMAAALLLAAIAILVNAWAAPAPAGATARGPSGQARVADKLGSLPVGWPLAAAGLAVGLAVGTKSTALAMAAALTVAVVALAPTGRRWAAAGWWFVPAVAGGGYWYLRNLIVSGNPLPQLEHLGPISLPHPERLQSGRPDFSIAHYATDTGVWRDYFEPGLHQAFGALWPLVVGGAIAGGLAALLWGRGRVLRWMGGVALFGMLAYVFTPLSAAGAEGAPVGFGINIRYAIPALLAGITLLPLAPIFAAGKPEARTSGSVAWWAPWVLLGVLLVVLVATDRSDAVLRDPNRLFGLLVAVLAVLVPAALLLWGAARRRDRDTDLVLGESARRAGEGSYGDDRPARGPRGQARAIVAAFAVLALGVAAIGYPVQRDYLHDRFRNDDPDTAVPGMSLDSAYRWARDVEDARIGLAGTTAGFLQYGFYGTDLSNRVRYLGVEGPHGAFNAIPACAGFRAAVDAAELDYLVTAPFLNFIHPSDPVPSPEAGWLRGEAAVAPVDRSGPVTVWRVRGRLDPAACGPRNAPLRRIPRQPG